jgi:TolB-like protein/DNA-binding winged helix-turn-helix (wHTH) protein
LGYVNVSGADVTRDVVRFGAFEADLRSEELRKYGQRLRVPGQSFQILKRLLDKPGQLVTREELQTKLWPADTFVDFDHGVNAAMNRLREALGDSADKPKFIETLPRRGYRFIGPINGVGAAEIAPGRVSSGGESAPKWRPSRPSWIGITLGACLAITVAATWIYFSYFAHKPASAPLSSATAAPGRAAPTAIRTIAVLPFKPLTTASRDEYLELGLADILINRLSSNRQLTVRSIYAIARYQGRDLDPIVVGREQKVDAVLEGTFQRLGQRIRVTARFVRVEDGSTIWAKRFETRSDDDFSAQDQIGEQISASLAPELPGPAPTLARFILRQPTSNPAAHESYLLARAT